MWSKRDIIFSSKVKISASQHPVSTSGVWPNSFFMWPKKAASEAVCERPGPREKLHLQLTLNAAPYGRYFCKSTHTISQRFNFPQPIWLKKSHTVITVHHHEHRSKYSLSSTYTERFSALPERNYDFAASIYTAFLMLSEMVSLLYQLQKDFLE